MSLEYKDRRELAQDAYRYKELYEIEVKFKKKYSPLIDALNTIIREELEERAYTYEE